MAKRYIGNATITINYRIFEDDYKGWIRAGGYTWTFDGLRAAPASRLARDSAKAYDQMAGSAVSFGSYYTTHNRGDDVPHWAPEPDVADAIDEATVWAMDDQGNYDVKRKKPGKNPSKRALGQKRNQRKRPKQRADAKSIMRRALRGT